ncbi:MULTISPECIES: molybdenum cofactor guanylyltransferase [Acidobacterium]|uniref:Probable molybdenum cofactor guanylyltransferase n=1 Tax=Acidobacterium capsulatum (strain ATCC 51196 / DSM 11244 / BCRC 80197 / JCM 7670 / NBRC 15755 / NCIMB 13165 / 161) TaxID=240015 RepID=C1F7H8_ACIC5|nr:MULTISPECIES: molybdenum cofactor guanylyltransferase [Acidobacterium]ACO33721.1 putative molybdopterin-guanine dinucleotide biosynthesis protein A [Acidobacterium capsulatum ATCC 51196]HCT59350.1 molybdenum cofactor guanylyltransferase [Acidobacterium sp.]
MTVSSTANSPTPSLRAFLLAGGRSSRMGQDKALLPIHGQPLVEQMLARLRALGLEATICGNRPDLAAYATILPDAAEACGPLGGITAALEASPAELNLVLAVDLPALPVEFLRWLTLRAALTGAPATIPYALGRPQPLCAVYHRNLAPGLRQSLASGDYRIMSAVHRVASRIDTFMVEQVAAAGAFSLTPPLPPVYTWFRNLNTPQDAARFAASHPSNKLEGNETAD